jgi:hypothetical protein
MAALSLVFDLIGRDISASRAFGNVGNAAERAGRQSSTAASLISSGMKMAGGALLGAGLIEGFKSLYEQAAESAKIGRLTTQVIKSTGGAAGISAKQVGALATSISNKVGYDDEAIQSGENLLLTFTNLRNEAGKGNDIFNQATSIMTDLSVALGQDTKTSAIQLGKALNDPIKGVSALQRVGVSFTASQKEQITTLVQTGKTLDAQKLILGELKKEFGGAAAAAATPLDKLKVSLGNLAENIGGYLIPIVDKGASFLNDKLIPAFSDLGPVISAAGSFLGGVVSAAGGLLEFFGGLPGPIKLTVGVIAALVLLKGPVAGFFASVDAAAGAAVGPLIAAGSAAGVARVAMSGFVTMLGGPVGLAITAITIGLGFLTSWLGKSDGATKDATAAQQSYADALAQSNGLITESVRQSAAKSAADAGVLSVAKSAGIALSSVTDAITGQGSAYDDVRAKLEAFKELHTHTYGDQYGNPVVKLDAEGKAAEGALTQLGILAGTTSKNAGAQRDMAEATGKVAPATGGATAAMQAYAAELDDASKSASDAKKQTDLFKLSLDILTGKTVDLIQVDAAFQDAVASATGATKDLHGAVLNASGGLNRSPRRAARPRRPPRRAQLGQPVDLHDDLSRASRPLRSPRRTPGCARVHPVRDADGH